VFIRDMPGRAGRKLAQKFAVFLLIAAFAYDTFN